MPKSKPKSTEVDATESLEPLNEAGDDVDPEESTEPPAKKKLKKPSGGSVATKKGGKEDADADVQEEEEEDEEEDEEEEEEEEDEPDENVDGVQIDWTAIRQWVKEFRSGNRRLPNASEISESMSFDHTVSAKIYKKMKNEADALSSKKKLKRIRGYHELARNVGFGYTPHVDKDGELVSIGRIDAGTDMIHPIVSMADTLRLATHLPLTPDAVSFSDQEFQDRMELIKTTLSQSSARAITANVDPLVRHIMNQSVKLQINMGGQKLNPSTMEQVLAPMVNHLAFSDVLAPPGIIKFSKDDAPPARRDYDAGDGGLKLYKKSLAAFNKKVKPNDRGIAAVNVDILFEGGKRSEAEKKIAKRNTAVAARNAKLYAETCAAIKKQREAAIESRKKKKNAVMAD